MGGLSDWLPVAVLAVITTVMIVRDPRRMRCGIFLSLTLFIVASNLFAYAAVFMQRYFPDQQVYVLLGTLVVALLLTIGIAVFLIVTGVVLIHREGFGISHSLSLIVGVGVALYIMLTIWSIISTNTTLATFLVFLGIPVFVFSFVLFSYLLYSFLYGYFVKRRGKVGQAVVVLGSGLINGQVPPLLARRVELGIEQFNRAMVRWPNAALVLSGGKGDDEVRPEGAAMLEYAIEHGARTKGSEQTIVAETGSANTRENVLFSREILVATGRMGPWTVVTSDFHAFRAATLMSSLKIPGNSMGAHSTVYFWVSAKLREFIAILADHVAWTIITVIFSGLPLFGFVAGQIVATF